MLACICCRCWPAFAADACLHLPQQKPNPAQKQQLPFSSTAQQLSAYLLQCFFQNKKRVSVAMLSLERARPSPPFGQ
jgi:hypothetical protein